MGILTIFVLLLLSSALYAQDLLSNVSSPMSDLCRSLSSLLPVLAMLLTMAAAVIYVSGQLMGAETRARANVWSTAALTGAMMAVLIAVVSPPILGAIAGEQISCSASGGGGLPHMMGSPGTCSICPDPGGCIWTCPGYNGQPVTCLPPQTSGQCSNTMPSIPSCC